MPSTWRTKNQKTGKQHPLWRYWYKDYQGVRQYGTGMRSRELTLKLARRLEEEHRQMRLGFRPLPIEELIFQDYAEVRDEYLDWGKAQGGRKGHPWSPTHLRNKVSRLRFWEEQLQLETLADLSGILAKVEMSMRELLRDGRAPKTVSDYADALESFCTWCVEREYLEENPLKHLKAIETTPEEERRALTLDEITRLLRVAPPKRRLIYLMALITGLRANELAHITSKHLDMKEGGLRLDPKWTKNRKAGFVWLPEYLTCELSELARKKKKGEALLEVPTHTARSLDIDLKVAGIAKCTEEGKIDFHALRATFVTLTIESGASPKEAQELARHSTIDLTHNTYARARKGRLVEITEHVAQTISLR